MNITKAKVIWFASLSALLLIALGTVLWVRRFHQYTPAEVLQDVRAGVAARHAARPGERFLELRYGPLSESANRQKAFLDFFNVGHIEGLHLLVNHMEDGERRTNINAMAGWVAGYRRSLSREERAALSARLSTPAGQAMLRQATARYLRQDVYYRAETAPVITELMATLAEIQKP